MAHYEGSYRHIGGSQTRMQIYLRVILGSRLGLGLVEMVRVRVRGLRLVRAPRGCRKAKPIYTLRVMWGIRMFRSGGIYGMCAVRLGE